MIFFNVSVLGFLLYVFKQISWIALWGMIKVFWLDSTGGIGWNSGVVYVPCTRIPGESYGGWLGCFFLCLCDVFRALINCLVCSYYLNQFRLQYYYYYIFGWELSRNRLPGGPLFLNTRMIVNLFTRENLSYSPLNLFTDYSSISGTFFYIFYLI